MLTIMITMIHSHVSSSKRLTASSAFHMPLESLHIIRNALPNSAKVFRVSADELVTNSHSISSGETNLHYLQYP